MKIALIFVALCLAVVIGTAQEQDDCSGGGICTFEYMPVCGVDADGNRRTFSNKCTMKVENCNNGGTYTLEKSGAC